jgi:transcriptional regulator with XRE-family HTH domain
LKGVDEMKQDIYLRAIIKSKGLKIVDVANKMGISSATLNRKIQGKVNFSDKNIDVLKEMLSMSYEEIFKYKQKNVEIKIEPINLQINKCDSTITEVSTGKIYKIPEELTKKIVKTIENAEEKKKEVI